MTKQVRSQKSGVRRAHNKSEVRRGHNKSEVRSQKSEGEIQNTKCHSCGSRNLGQSKDKDRGHSYILVWRAMLAHIGNLFYCRCQPFGPIGEKAWLRTFISVPISKFIKASADTALPKYVRSKSEVRSLVYIVTITFLLLLFVSPAVAKQPPSAPQVGSETLIKYPHRYDEKTISFTGEAIGDVLIRGDQAWINVNDDAYSRQGKNRHLAGFNKGQSILISADKVGVVQRLGNYTNRGDLLRVQGVFHAACTDHGGAMMIHAEDLQIISNGFSLSNPISRRKISLALFWLVSTAVVLLLWKWRVGDSRY